MTTIAEIRGRLEELVGAIVPQRDAETRFVRHRSEIDGSLERWCVGRPGAFRVFQVRDRRTWATPDIGNSQIEVATTVFEARVAYPHTNRTGIASARDRADVIRSDQHQIEAAIGAAAIASFDGSSGPRAEWLGTLVRRASVAGVELLVLEHTMRFRRSAVQW